MQAPSSLHLTTLPVSATKPATSIELYSNVHTTLCNCLYCMFHVCNFRYLFLHYFVANQLSWYIIFFHVRSYVTNVKDKLNQIKFLNLLRHLTTGALGCLTLNTHKIIAKIKKNKTGNEDKQDRICELCGMLLLRRRERGTEKVRLKSS